MVLAMTSIIDNGKSKNDNDNSNHIDDSKEDSDGTMN